MKQLIEALGNPEMIAKAQKQLTDANNIIELGKLGEMTRDQADAVERVTWMLEGIIEREEDIAPECAIALAWLQPMLKHHERVNAELYRVRTVRVENK